MSNEWRTLKEIYEEGHELPVRVQWFRNQEEGAWLINRLPNGELCYWNEGDDVVDILAYSFVSSRSWRIYEEPKQPKKWAPALVVRSSGRVEQTMEWYNSKKHAESDYPVTKNVIWPAPGFTPVEIP